MNNTIDREEIEMTIAYLKEMQETYIEGCGYEIHPLPEWYALDKAIQVLESCTKEQDNRFTVIDKKTGEYPDVCKIARKEDWAKDLIYCDIDSFAIMENGSLILTDDYGDFAYCPKDRFEVKGYDKS